MKSLRELISKSIFFGLCQKVGSKEMGIRRQAREIALQAIYMIDFNSQWSDYQSISFQSKSFFDSFDFDKGSLPFAEVLIQGVVENRIKLDSVITRASENWSIQRMARVDRALLRVSCFELCCLPDVPRNVSINEAVEIAKRFGSDDSPMFINGVLDKIANYIQQVSPSSVDGSKHSNLEEVFDDTLPPQKVRA